MPSTSATLGSLIVVLLAGYLVIGLFCIVQKPMPKPRKMWMIQEDDKHHVVCDGCLRHWERKTRIYIDNIEPFQQHCARCGRLLVQAKQEGWPDLFTC